MTYSAQTRVQSHTHRCNCCSDEDACGIGRGRAIAARVAIDRQSFEVLADLGGISRNEPPTKERV